MKDIKYGVAFAGFVVLIVMVLIFAIPKVPLGRYLELRLELVSNERRHKAELKETKARFNKLTAKAEKLLKIRSRQIKKKQRLSKEFVENYRQYVELKRQIQKLKGRTKLEKHELKKSKDRLKELKKRLEGLKVQKENPLPSSSTPPQIPPPSRKLSPEDIKKIQQLEKQRDALPLRR